MCYLKKPKRHKESLYHSLRNTGPADDVADEHKQERPFDINLSSIKITMLSTPV